MKPKDCWNCTPTSNCQAHWGQPTEWEERAELHSAKEEGK